MASMLTDEEREIRYIGLRRKKRRYETIKGICMAATLLSSAATIIPLAFTSILQSTMFQSAEFLFAVVLSLIACGFAVYALYQTNVKITIIAMVVAGLDVPFTMGDAVLSSGYMALIPLALAVKAFVDVQWKKLSQEEGFPLFQISLREMEERKKLAESRTRHRAVEAGIREQATVETSDEMIDLLDVTQEKDLVSANLHGYHNRGDRNAVVGQVKQVQVGEMDEL